MEMKMQDTKRYMKNLLSIMAGAGTVIGGVYIFSRLKEKQDTETRLERMEQILEEIKPEEKEK